MDERVISRPQDSFPDCAEKIQLSSHCLLLPSGRVEHRDPKSSFGLTVLGQMKIMNANLAMTEFRAKRQYQDH
jgi:hypothetical protein